MKNYINVTSLKKKFNEQILKELKEFLIEEDSKKKSENIIKINKNKDLKEEDKLFITHKVLSLPINIRKKIAEKL